MCCLACIVPRMMNLINIKSNARGGREGREGGKEGGREGERERGSEGMWEGGREGRGGEGGREFTSMSGTILPTMCQIVVVIQ